MSLVKSTCAFFVVTTLGSLFVTAGLYLTFNWVDIFTQLRTEEMSLSPTSQTFLSFKNPPLPVYFDVYLFNWTNPKDFYVGSKRKPNFQQLGPYRFRDIKDLVNITWHKHNHSITYRNFPTFHFVPELSNGSLSDMITSVDSVNFEAARNLSGVNAFYRSFGNFMIGNIKKEITVTHTAEEWIFKGFKHPILERTKSLSQWIPSIPKVDIHAGLLFGRNQSAKTDGWINIYTGADNLQKMGQLYNWNFSNRTVYPGDCGKVKGSMGAFFSSNLKPNKTLYMFIPDYCRYIALDHVDTVEIHGVKGFKYAGSYRTLDNGTIYPENKCFCNNECGPSGVMNISPCVQNASIRISFPHFYLADPSYLEAVEGLNPEREKHEFFLVLEPNTGIPIHVGGGFQGNILLYPLNMRPYTNIPKTLIPLMWAEERIVVPKELLGHFSLLVNIILGGHVVAGVLLALGIILIFWYPVKQLKQLWHDPKAKSKMAITRPQLVETAVNTVVAHIKRPCEQMALIELKNPNIPAHEEHTTERLLNTDDAYRGRDSKNETSHK